MCGCLSALGVLISVYLVIVALIKGKWDIAAVFLVVAALCCLMVYFFKDDRG
jgi:hypothetical protein